MCSFRSLGLIVPLAAALTAIANSDAQAEHEHDQHVEFSLRSVKDGAWTDAQTWAPARVPKQGDRVLVSRGTTVEYDANSKEIIRLIQIVGTLRFARDRNTELNVGLVKVQDSDACSESGFACDFRGTNPFGEPSDAPEGGMPALLVGEPEAPIPAEFTARIRLHYLEGMPKEDAPAIACCSARMEFHGVPLKHAWLKLAADAKPGDRQLVLAEPVDDWRPGDEVIVTASQRTYGDTYRGRPDRPSRAQTETRHIAAVSGVTLSLDQPLKFAHSGAGEFRCICRAT